MENIYSLIRSRRSVRTFEDSPLSQEHLDLLCSFMAKIENPYEIPVEFQLLDAKEKDLKSPVLNTVPYFLAAKVKRLPHAEEALGYSLEMLVLYAHSLGVGTVWIGGTMDRGAFERAVHLTSDERMPCISPLGYPAAQMSLRETMMRKGVKADSRNSFTELFFDGSFQKPLTETEAGNLREVLEAVRWAPSAVNKQPWRLLRDGNAVHFYEKKSKGYVSDAVGDMQKIDIGIALCHFAMAAQESGLTLRFEIQDPGFPVEADTEYIASYHID